jgi:hypothetical protein
MASRKQIFPELQVMFWVKLRDAYVSVRLMSLVIAEYFGEFKTARINFL